MFLTIGVGALLLAVNVWFLLCLFFCRNRLSCCLMQDGGSGNGATGQVRRFNIFKNNKKHFKSNWLHLRVAAWAPRSTPARPSWLASPTERTLCTPSERSTLRSPRRRSAGDRPSKAVRRRPPLGLGVWAGEGSTNTTITNTATTSWTPPLQLK